jgi:hypothetical protein
MILGPHFPVARKKPAYGEPCNRCGLCCMTDPCRVAQAVLLLRQGPCPALRSDGLGGYFCGLLSELPTQAEQDAARFIIGAGVWCDMLETPEDAARRNALLPALEEKIEAQRQALTPEARAVVAAWVARLEAEYGLSGVG